MTGVQALDVSAAVDKGEQAGRCARRDAERIGDLLSVEATQLGDCYRSAERTHRTGRMKATLAQVRRARAREADRDFVTGDNRFNQLRAGDAALIAHAQC